MCNKMRTALLSFYSYKAVLYQYPCISLVHCVSKKFNLFIFWVYSVKRWLILTIFGNIAAEKIATK